MDLCLSRVVLRKRGAGPLFPPNLSKFIILKMLKKDFKFMGEIFQPTILTKKFIFAKTPFKLGSAYVFEDSKKMEKKIS